MCGIAGFVNFRADYLYNESEYENILKDMGEMLYHRGPDEQNIYLSPLFGLSHTRLSIIDIKSGHQPMTLNAYGNSYYIVYNGEIYNTAELRADLINTGWHFKTTSDTEVILVGFAEYGIKIAEMLNGIFAFFVVDEKNRQAYLVRDHAGVKPLYYSIFEDTVIFGSEIKALFAYPDVEPELDKNGLNQILSIGPAKYSGSGVFRHIDEVLPGHYLKIDFDNISMHKYWGLKAFPFEMGYEETVEYTSFLVTDAIKRQMVSDVPIATFLSGGIDSSIVSSVCGTELKKQGKKLGTFSFEFTGNDKYFKSNAFQPTLDRPYVDIMVDYIGSSHKYLECNNADLIKNLYASVDVRDLPTMADVDSSMLHFCQLVSPSYKVVLTGECADEIFGGYPWFYREDLLNSDTFPWTKDFSARKAVLKDDLIAELHMEDFAKAAYDTTISEAPIFEDEDKASARRRKISYLNMRWFMQTLLDRMDRTSMYSGLEARVPFADYRIIEFMYNVPWEMKYRNGVEKHLLREACKHLLPPDILSRKKSPYPKTYDPSYENALAELLMEIINNSSSPINRIVDKKKIYTFINEKKDYGKPWFGQLMAGPQMLAYLLQINYWMEKFGI